MKFVHRLLLTVALSALVAGVAPTARAEVHQGCQECNPDCRNVRFTTYGRTICEDGSSMSIKDLGITCTTSGDICYRDSTSIDVFGSYPDNDFNCSIWVWLMFGC